MTDIKSKKTASLFVVGLVIAGFAFGFAGVGAVQVLDNGSTVLPQQDSFSICESYEEGSGDTDPAEGLQSLVTNLFNFIIYGGTIGAFVLAVWTKVSNDFGVGDGGDSDGWTGPIKKAFMMYIIIYGGAIAMNMIFGIDVTCTLPGFPGSGGGG